MLDQIKQLLALQALDQELSSDERENAAIPAQRDALREACLEARQQAEEAQSAYQAAEVGQRHAETELQDQEALIHKLEGQQFQVKSNAAYTALLHELETAKAAISDCETRILEAMEEIEAASRAREAAEAAVQAAEQRAAEAGRSLDEREKELGECIASLGERRRALCAELDPRSLELYERIASRRQPALVRIEREICQGCRVNVPPQLSIELLRGTELITCGNCHRILIPQEK